jgi:sulfur carrier protein ThiS adenylyltransferase
MSLLSDQSFLRYQRQIALEDIGETGQIHLRKKRALVIGCGGLGCGASLYLAGAGIGSLVLVDPDSVEVSNLHRQVAYRKSDLGVTKVSALSKQLNALNHECHVRTIDKKLDDEQLQLEVMMADVVLDCSDNLQTRHQINRICYQQKTALVSGSAIGWNGQLSIYRYQKEEPCYRCLVPDEELNHHRCSDMGVLGPVVGTISSLQALQAIQILCLPLAEISKKADPTAPSANEFFHFDGKKMLLQSFPFEKDDSCPVCGGKGSTSGCEENVSWN